MSLEPIPGRCRHKKNRLDFMPLASSTGLPMWHPDRLDSTGTIRCRTTASLLSAEEKSYRGGS